MNINEPKSTASLPTKGNFETKVPKDQKGPNGSYIIRAAYKDKGSKTMKSLATEDILVLRNPILNPELADVSKGTNLVITPGRSFSMIGNNSYLGYKNIDLSNISEIEVSASAQTRVGAAGGVIELRKGAIDGPIIGTSDKIVPQDFRQGPPPAAATPTPGTTATATPPPAQPRRQGGSKLKIAIPANTGQSDIYFVFKNEEAKEKQNIMSVSAIEFKSGE